MGYCDQKKAVRNVQRVPNVARNEMRAIVSRMSLKRYFILVESEQLQIVVEVDFA